MIKTRISGKAFVVGDDLDTDQIIAAEYLSYNPADPEERKYYGMYAMAGVPRKESGLPDGNVTFVAEGQFKGPYKIVIGGRNFGCGSSREHAPLALAEAGVSVVIAEFYARIFYRNCVNGGYLLPCQSAGRIVDQIRTGDDCQVDMQTATVTNNATGKSFDLCPMGDVSPIIEAGGIFEYAKTQGMLKG